MACYDLRIDFGRTFFRHEKHEKMKLFSNEQMIRANPKEVPFGYWFLHEIANMLGAMVSGFFIAFVFLIFAGITLQLLASQYPNFTFRQFQNAVCEYQIK